MPHKSRLKLPAVDLGDETIGQRIRRFRKRRGLTQVQLAEKIGIVQNLISDYERGRLRLHAEMVARFARALGVSCDELIGFGGDSERGAVRPGKKQSLAIIRRMNKIQDLPPAQKRTVLRTIDMLIKAAEG